MDTNQSRLLDSLETHSTSQLEQTYPEELIS